MKKVYAFSLLIFFSSLLFAQQEGNYPVIESKSSSAFNETIDQLKKAAEEKGWKVPIVHNLQESLKKAGQDVLPVSVIELCHPAYSGAILKDSKDRSISVLMPCRISVYQKDDGEVYISRMDPGSLSGYSFDNSTIESMSKAFNDIESLIEALSVK
jgi:uncharacterized protein (DUF302 family)